MTGRAIDELHFLITNRIPRRAATLFVGWISRIENPWVVSVGLFIWRICTRLDLAEAQSQRFDTLRDCFTRALRPGLRPVDPDPAVWVSPCDAIVGECGPVVEGRVLQIKGMGYAQQDLLGGTFVPAQLREGTYVTLRLTADMYHRFHAPVDCWVRRVTYISGDTWNVNPVSLQRVARLFCLNERAVLECEVAPDSTLLLVPVAAILVASIRLHCLPQPLHLRYQGPNQFSCEARFRKGEEMGWFELGSTIVAFAPKGLVLVPGIASGSRVKMGEALFRVTAPSNASAQGPGSMASRAA